MTTPDTPPPKSQIDQWNETPTSTSVRSDSERLDWLEKRGCFSDPYNGEWVSPRIKINGKASSLRSAIDAAMSQRTGE